MSESLLVISLVLAALAATFLLAEWLARRYAVEVRRRMEPFADEDAADPGDSRDPFDSGGRSNW